VATYFTAKDIKQYESTVSTMLCNAIGLNSHFPQALLHGSTLLGGIGIPTQTQKTTKDRINYFLYNMQRPSPVRNKLEASILYTQLEVGIFDQFLSSSFVRYGHLATMMFAVKIWSESEPYGIKLRASTDVTGTPSPFSSSDLSIMEMATQKYDKRRSTMINQCCLYLRIISIFELLTFNLSSIHPSYKNKQIPPSRSPNIHWPQFEKPPWHYWQLWHHFLCFHVEPYIASKPLLWDTNIPLRHSIIYFKHRHHFHLYKLEGTDILEYRLARRQRRPVVYNVITA